MRRGLAAALLSALLLATLSLGASPNASTVTDTQRFAMRSWDNGSQQVWVSASDQALVVRAHSAAMTGIEVANLVEQAAAAVSKRRPDAPAPRLGRAARAVNRHGLFHLELLDAIPRALLVELASEAILAPEIMQTYPVLTRFRGRAFYDDHLVVTAHAGRLNALLTKVLPSIDGTLVRRPRVADTALVRVGERFAFDAVEAASWLSDSGLFTNLMVAEPNLYKEMELRALTNDPLAPTQWHLYRHDNSVPGTGEIFADEAWDITLGDPSIIIAVADTGTDVTHEDLVANIVGGFDAVDNDDDPTAECTNVPITENEAPSCPASRPYRESHGTAVSGVAAARGNNNTGVAGVCPSCSLMPIRLLPSSSNEETISSLTAAETFIRAADEGAAVINNSWGPGYSRYFPLSNAEREGLRYARLQGRGGLGTVVLFAAGNDSADVSADAYARNADVMAIAGTTNLDDWAYYSNWGAEIDVAAPTLGGAVDDDDYGIGTTDLTDGDGYDSTSYSNYFSGTSASSPVAACLAGLILSANPALTADQVRIIMTSTADKIVADKVDWIELFGEDIEAGWAYDDTGHSYGFGYGRINAGAAVTAAATPTLQGALCTAPGCPDCDADGRCRLTCTGQSDCPDGSVCQDGLCNAPRPGPTDVGEPCNTECPYCLPGIDSEFGPVGLCTDVCDTDDDCPSGFDCRLIDQHSPKLCTHGKDTTGAPHDFRTCFDSLHFAYIVTESDQGQAYCTDMCIKGSVETCPYGFHCGFARCDCTDEMGGFWCIEYTCREAAHPDFANWDTDLCIPDPGFGDECQDSIDCKLGDYCGPDGKCRIDDRDGCLACTECERDSDCGPRAWCVDLDDGLGERCLVGCDTDGACPGNGRCADVSIGRMGRMYDVCISPWFYEGPGCDPDWTCEVACRDDMPCAEGEICTELGACLPWTEPEPEDETDDEDGCAAAPVSAWSLMAVLPLVWRRRR